MLEVLYIFTGDEGSEQCQGQGERGSQEGGGERCHPWQEEVVAGLGTGWGSYLIDLGFGTGTRIRECRQ